MHQIFKNNIQLYDKRPVQGETHYNIANGIVTVDCIACLTCVHDVIIYYPLGIYDPGIVSLA